jgi:hypothetical protein
VALTATKPERGPLNFGVFWRLAGQLLARLMSERAHAEVVFTLRDGEVRLVRINRSFEPQQLAAIVGPETPS